MIQIDRDEAKARVAKADMADIFALDGKTYSIPRAERSEIALRYLEVANERGDDAANYYLLTEMLGQEGYDALKSVDGLTREQYDAVTDMVSAIVMPKANPKGRAA